MIVSSCEKESDFQITDGNVYIYEYPRKNYGQAIMGFIITNDSLVVQDISFKIYFSDDKLKKVKYGENKRFLLRGYERKDDGNIEIESLIVECCSSKNLHKTNNLTIMHSSLSKTNERFSKRLLWVLSYKLKF